MADNARIGGVAAVAYRALKHPIGKRSEVLTRVVGVKRDVQRQMQKCGPCEST